MYISSFRCLWLHLSLCCFFFFNDTAPTEIYPFPLPDALPILMAEMHRIDDLMSHYKPDSQLSQINARAAREPVQVDPELLDRKSTRLNSSHLVISYAVFCLKKKKINTYTLKISHSTHPSIHLP